MVRGRKKKKKTSKKMIFSTTTNILILMIKDKRANLLTDSDQKVASIM